MAFQEEPAGALAPGNGFFEAETNGWERARQHLTGQLRPFAAKEMPPFRRICRHTGKSLPSQECVVVDAVDLETVSTANSPQTGKNTGIFARPRVTAQRYTMKASADMKLT
jgi:hypothetical protein